MDQKAFHKLYEATPEDVKYELVGGVVYMASPQREHHGSRNTELIAWLRNYKVATPGTQVTGDSTTILGKFSEPQPDGSLRVLPEYGGQCKPNKDGYLVGPPELVAETSHSTESYDLNQKLRDYHHAGVKEYLVVALRRERIYWHVRRRGTGPFVLLNPGADGIYKSPFFGGLWLDPDALLRMDSEAVDTALRNGLASAEHARFVAALARQKK